MKEQKHFFARHKALIIVAAILLAAAIAGAAVGIVFRLRDKTEAPEEEKNLAEIMADLVNEPVSDLDETYQPSEETDKGTNPVRIMVNKQRNCITVYEKDEKGEFNTPVKAMNCSVGYNTPLGTYQTSDRYTWKIVNGNVWAQYATRITGNVLFHSVPYSEKNKAALITRYYNQLGSSASAGCIRVMASDAKWLMEHCDEGTEVEIYEDEDPGPLGKPVSILVAETEQWDPSDPDPANPWSTHSVVLSGAGNRTVQRNIDFDYLEGLQGIDTVGNDVTDLIEVDTDLDLTKTGTYKVTYTLTDGVGSTASTDVVYTVEDTLPPSFSGIKKEIQVTSETDVTAASLLEKVYVVDNNEILSTDKVSVSIPDLTAGEGDAVYSVTDDYGNTSTATTHIIVDNEPPQIFRYADAGSILSNSQVVNEEYALSRVYAVDNGAELPKSSIRVTIYNADWGYTFVYVATDKGGLTTTYTDAVSYMSYTLSSNGTINVTDLGEEQLMRGVILTNSAGEVISGEGVQITTQALTGNSYMVNYVYTYSSPLGTREATTSRTVTLTVSPTATPAPSSAPSSAAPSAAPSVAPTAAAPSDEPQASEAPTEPQDTESVTE